MPDTTKGEARVQREQERAAPRIVCLVLWFLPVARVAMVPVFVVTALRVHELAKEGSESGVMRGVLVAVLALLALSDAADGWLARRYGLASEAGAILDAASDKIAQVTLVALFTFMRGPAFTALPIWLLMGVLARDLTLAGGLLALRWRRVPFEVVHHTHGRASLVAVLSVLFWVTIGLPASGVPILSLLAVTVAAASAASYAIEASRETPR